MFVRVGLEGRTERSTARTYGCDIMPGMARRGIVAVALVIGGCGADAQQPAVPIEVAPFYCTERATTGLGGCWRDLDGCEGLRTTDDSGPCVATYRAACFDITSRMTGGPTEFCMTDFEDCEGMRGVVLESPEYTTPITPCEAR